MFDLPEGYVLCTDYYQLCKLKLYKKKRIPSNLTPRIGMVLFAYSEIHDKYYKRILQVYTSEDLLRKLIERQVLYYKPQQEDAQPQIPSASRRSDFSGITD